MIFEIAEVCIWASSVSGGGGFRAADNQVLIRKQKIQQNLKTTNTRITKHITNVLIKTINPHKVKLKLNLLLEPKNSLLGSFFIFWIIFALYGLAFTSLFYGFVYLCVNFRAVVVSTTVCPRTFRVCVHGGFPPGTQVFFYSDWLSRVYRVPCLCNSVYSRTISIKFMNVLHFNCRSGYQLRIFDISTEPYFHFEPVTG